MPATVIDLDKFIEEQTRLKKERRGGIDVRITFYHADDIFDVYKYQAPFHIKKQWWNFKVYHESLIDNEDAWWDCAADLVQARHFLMGLTAVLKELLEWDWLSHEPAEEVDNDVTVH